MVAVSGTGKFQSAIFYGIQHDFGFGAPEDDPEAAKWYRLAAEQGDSRVQIFMGFMYDFGYGVQEDDIEAVKWYRLAAEKGYTQANTSIYAWQKRVFRNHLKICQIP